MLKHDEINQVKDFWPLLKKSANSLDIGDFKQILLYFGFSTWTHFEYWIKSSTVTYSFFCFFRFNNMYIFLHKKKINFLSSSSFKICKMYTFDPYFLARNHEYFIFFICPFCGSYLCTDILLMHTTYRPSMFSVFL